MKMAKLQLILLLCLALFSCSNSFPYITDDLDASEAVDVSKYSPAAQQQLRQAASLALDYLCNGDDINPEISSTICNRAAQPASHQEMKGARGVKRACFDCTVADPICYNSCPQ